MSITSKPRVRSRAGSIEGSPVVAALSTAVAVTRGAAELAPVALAAWRGANTDSRVTRFVRAALELPPAGAQRAGAVPCDVRR